MQCTVCALEKEPAAFAPDKRRSSGRKSECLDCERELDAKRAPNTMLETLVNTQQAPKLPALPEERLSLAIQQRMDFYQCAALDALYDLAMMPQDKNSALMQVKYLAALRLAGAQPPAPGTGGVGSTVGNFNDVLKSLNAEFHAKAPKLREIRERIATFENGESVALSAETE